MDEVGPGVVADPPAIQEERRLLEAVEFDAGDAHIESTPLQMKTVGGNTVPLALQQGIVAGGTISGDDVNVVATAELLVEESKVVKGARVDRMDFVGVVAAQQTVKFAEGRRIVSAGGGTVYICQALAGVGVEKGKRGRRR